MSSIAAQINKRRNTNPDIPQRRNGGTDYQVGLPIDCRMSVQHPADDKADGNHPDNYKHNLERRLYAADGAQTG